MTETVTVDFNNTANAYAARSLDELKNARWMFSVLQKPFLGRLGQRLLRFSVKTGLPVNGAIKKTMYRQFIGGESRAEALELAEKLHKFGVYSILDYAIEGSEDQHSFADALNEFKQNIELCGNSDYIPMSVFKPSAIATSHNLLEMNQKSEQELKSDDRYLKLSQRFDQIFSSGSQMKVPVMVDAEHSWYQEVIDLVTRDMMLKYNHTESMVYNTFQMYRKDRYDYLLELHKWCKENNIKLGVKLVRGAYMEQERVRAAENGYPSPIHETKAGTDKFYNLAVKYILENIDDFSVVIATHNEQSCYYAMELMEQENLPNNDSRIWFSQLYGMCDHISYNMGDAGYNVAKYIPYGKVKSVIPYLTRRAEENSSISGQVAREIGLIKNELLRRRGQLR